MIQGYSPLRLPTFYLDRYFTTQYKAYTVSLKPDTSNKQNVSQEKWKSSRYLKRRPNSEVKMKDFLQMFDLSRKLTMPVYIMNTYTLITVSTQHPVTLPILWPVTFTRTLTKSNYFCWANCVTISDTSTHYVANTLKNCYKQCSSPTGDRRGICIHMKSFVCGIYYIYKSDVTNSIEISQYRMQ